MPLTGALAAPAFGRRSPVAARLLVALGAIALVGAAFVLIAWVLAPAAPPPPARGPFGMAREAAPAATGLGGAILALQGSFYRALQAAVSALRETGSGIWPLVGIGFAYGVFHAAGPGHGKAVIAAYLVSSGRALRRGLSLSLAAALVQAGVAIALVGTLALVVKVTAGTMSRVTNAVEAASFAAVAALGLAVTWRKAGGFLAVLALGRGEAAGTGPACDHVHLPPPEALDRITRWREAAGVVLAAGIRPCAGAIVVLVFALSQGLFAAGIAAVVAMALGTAVTTGAIASLAVVAKALALRLAGGRGLAAARGVAGLELLAAAFVAALGLALLAGLWTGPSGS